MTCPNCKKDLSAAQWVDQRPPTDDQLADPGFVWWVVCCYCMTISQWTEECLIALDPGMIEQIPGSVLEAIRRRQRWLYLKKAEAN